MSLHTSLKVCSELQLMQPLAQKEHAPHRCSLPVAGRITHLPVWCLCASHLEAWSLFSRSSWSVIADHFLSCEPNVLFPVCGLTSALWSGLLCWPCPSSDRTWSAHFPALTVINFPVLQLTLAQSSTVQKQTPIALTSPLIALKCLYQELQQLKYRPLF